LRWTKRSSSVVVARFSFPSSPLPLPFFCCSISSSPLEGAQANADEGMEEKPSPPPSFSFSFSLPLQGRGDGGQALLLRTDLFLGHRFPQARIYGPGGGSCERCLSRRPDNVFFFFTSFPFSIFPFCTGATTLKRTTTPLFFLPFFFFSLLAKATRHHGDEAETARAKSSCRHSICLIPPFLFSFFPFLLSSHLIVGEDYRMLKALP